MPELRSMQCDICGEVLTEPKYGSCFPGWGRAQGISITEKDTEGNDIVKQVDIILCPKHLNVVAKVLNSLEEEFRHGRPG